MTDEPSTDDVLQRLEQIKNLSPGSRGDNGSYVRKHLEHENDEVRAKAVSCMWDYAGEEDADLILDLAKHDSSPDVRVNAIKVLGRYMHEGSMEMFESDDGPWEDPYTEHRMTMDQYERMRDFLLETFRDRENASVDERRYALEALSFLHREDVGTFIDEAYDDDRPEMKQSALFAMSRRKTTDRADRILEALDHEEEKVRYEAIRAAGDCGIEAAHQTLLNIAQSTEDRSLFRHVVNSIAKLGLQESFTYLDQLNRQSRVDVDREFARHAMQEWRFHNDVRENNMTDDFPDEL